jgi:hypothetical protein
LWSDRVGGGAGAAGGAAAVAFAAGAGSSPDSFALEQETSAGRWLAAKIRRRPDNSPGTDEPELRQPGDKGCARVRIGVSLDVKLAAKAARMAKQQRKGVKDQRVSWHAYLLSTINTWSGSEFAEFFVLSRG